MTKLAFSFGRSLARVGQIAQCPATVHETVCVQADVTITPSVVVGDVESFCVGDPIIGACPGTPSPTGTCTFTVSQNICVEIPLTFSAGATAVPSGIVCGKAQIGQCVPPSFTCCEFIMATQGTTDSGTKLKSLSIQLCGPAGQCSPQGNHINIEFPASGPNFEINLEEMISMQCDTPSSGLITVTAQAIFNNGAGNSELANFTFVFDSTNNTVHITATSVASGNTLLDTTITLTGNVHFEPCVPSIS
ncbi:hypothetical protein [Desulfosporosinus sp. FKA]|uniref:hypothetical protein n=1 Tax=Desulfosporosinus sp. FKA TaxID=1969834 RepID=UPI001FA867E2|nr:hypothetical protein [Desulfosporosinus sp. FKA]